MSGGKYCSAFNCTNNEKNTSFSFHRFAKDEAIRSKWILATKRKDFKPSNTAVLCSKHFEIDALDKIGGIRKRLKKNAIPTIFDFPPHLQPSKPKIRRVLFRSQTTSASSSTMSPELKQQAYAAESNEVPSSSTEGISFMTKHLSQPVKTTRLSPKKVIFSPTKQKLRRKVKLLQDRIRRRDKKIKEFSDIIKLINQEKTRFSS